MSFFKASRKAEDVKSGGSAYVNGSGVYPVTILAPVVSVSNNGSTSVDMFIEHNGQKQIIYGNLRITNNNGAENKIGSKVFNQLLVVSGVDNVADPVEVDLPIGKGGAMKTVSGLADLSDIECLMRIQMEYGIWNGSFTEKKVIKGFYRADKATAEEIVNDSDVGAGYEKDSKYFNNVTYQDGVTPEAIQAWVSANRPKDTAGDSGEAKPAPSFGNKRFGK